MASVPRGNAVRATSAVHSGTSGTGLGLIDIVPLLLPATPAVTTSTNYPDTPTTSQPAPRN